MKIKRPSDRDPNWDANLAQYQLEENARHARREKIVNEIMAREGGSRLRATHAMHISQWFIEKAARLEKVERLADQIIETHEVSREAAVRLAGVWLIRMAAELSPSGENE